MRLATLLVLLLVALPLAAQTPGNCEPGTAQADLDISDVRARLFTNGNLFFGNTTVSGDGYIVPKFSGHSPLFDANVWVAGFVGGDLRVAGSTYLDFEFWPGPLEPSATLPSPNDCSEYDRIWVVSTLDLLQYEQTGVATTDLAEWPVDLGAEVIDGDGVEGNYDLEGGDRPRIYGSQTAFWVMNDVGNEHAFSESQPIGLEVRVTAFASAEEPFQHHTFYRYELVNRNSLPLEDARLSVWADFDLGDGADDYIGSDSTRGLAFVYNAHEEDVRYGTPPAAGLDVLNGSVSSRWPKKSNPHETTGPPSTPPQFYNAMSGLWNDGLPITEGDDGYMSDGPVVDWMFPGDPITEQFWSMVNDDGSGGSAPPVDVRHLLNAPAFTLAPGESRTFDFAVLFAQGADHLDSITELRAASDAVQAAYDDGTLFDLVAPGTVLPTPEPLAPEEGAFFVEQLPLLQWSSVPGAEGYTVRVGLNPSLEGASTFSTTETEAYPGGTPANEVVDVYWQVRAEDGMGGLSPYSELRSFQFYHFEPDNYGDGIGVIETAFPDAEVCPDGSDDPGCAEGYPGNTVWLSPNSTADYVLTNPRNRLWDLLGNLIFSAPDDFEIRFSDACAEPGACLSVYPSAGPDGNDLIASVPFELWNIGAEDDPDDDVRMIPFLRALNGAEPTTAWADTFPDEQEVVAGEDTLMLPVTQRISGMIPDRPNGHALFEAAANSFGGPGATYDPENDGDDQIDINPGTGEPCGRQNYYVDFCYQGESSLFVAPIGGLEGIVLADLAGDGTTPPVGTTIRFDSNEPLFVDAEDDAPATQPQTLALDAAYPNPFRGSTTVNYRLEQPADVRLAVYDVLGRRVAMLVDDAVAAGTHRTTFEAHRLATGVYLVVLEAEGQRVTRKVLLLR